MKHSVTLELDDNQLSELMVQIEASLECAPSIHNRIPSKSSLEDTANALLQSIEQDGDSNDAPCWFGALQLVPIYAKLLPAWQQALQRREHRKWATSDFPDAITKIERKLARRLIREAGLQIRKIAVPQSRKASPEHIAAVTKLVGLIEARDILGKRLFQAVIDQQKPAAIEELRTKYQRAAAKASKGVKQKNSTVVLHAA